MSNSRLIILGLLMLCVLVLWRLDTLTAKEVVLLIAGGLLTFLRHESEPSTEGGATKTVDNSETE